MPGPELPWGRLLWLLLPLGVVYLVLGDAGALLRRRLPGAALRACVQLALIGYVLVFVFDADAPALTFLTLGASCVLAAVFSLLLLARPGRWRLLPLALAAILPTVLGLAVFAAGIVVATATVLDARHLVGLGGMLAGNAMNAVSLAGERFLAGLRDRRGEVEAMLMAGAGGSEAVQPLRADALRAAVTPSLNGLLSVGLVSLPGMMTGQILAGGDPLVAARYQMMVMALWLAAAAVAPAIFLRLLGRTQVREGRLAQVDADAAWTRFEAPSGVAPARRAVVYDHRPGQGGAP